MMKFIINLKKIITVATIILLPLSTTAAIIENKGIINSQSELKDVQTNIKKITKAIEKTRQQQAKAQQDLANIEIKLGDSSKKLTDIDKQIKQNYESLKNLEVEKQQYLAKQIVIKEQLKQQAEAAFIMGRNDKLQSLLNQKDISVASRIITYHDFIGQARLKTLNEFNATIQNLNIVATTINAKQQDLQGLKQQQIEQQQSLITLNKNRSQILSKIAAQLKTDEDKLKNLNASEKELKVLLQGLKRQALIASQQKKPFHQMRGQLILPVTGTVKASFGSPLGVGKLTSNGQLIKAEQGTEVKAVYRGKVVFSNWLRGFGLLTIIDHGDGYMSLYGHNQSLNRKAGEWVNQGDVIAEVGKSGGFNESGLYFEIRKNGKPQDPAKWLRRS